MKRPLLIALVCLLMIPVPVLGQTRPRPMTIYNDAPDFSAPDLTGKTVNLSDFKNKSEVLLVFYRGWLGDHF